MKTNSALDVLEDQVAQLFGNIKSPLQSHCAHTCMQRERIAIERHRERIERERGEGDLLHRVTG